MSHWTPGRLGERHRTVPYQNVSVCVFVCVVCVLHGTTVAVRWRPEHQPVVVGVSNGQSFACIYTHTKIACILYALKKQKNSRGLVLNHDVILVGFFFHNCIFLVWQC